MFNVAIPKESIFKLFDGKQIIMCENQNQKFYNLLNLKNNLFLGLQNRDEVYFHVKKEDSKYYGLIDRDFLTDEELNVTREKYDRLHILNYYCFENYLYHPNNLQELFLDLDVPTYIDSITNQKNEQKAVIASKIERARRSYTILKEENEFRYDRFGTIIEALDSDEFERFYPILQHEGFQQRKYSLFLPVGKKEISLYRMV